MDAMESNGSIEYLGPDSIELFYASRGRNKAERTDTVKAAVATPPSTLSSTGDLHLASMVSPFSKAFTLSM